MSRQGLHRCLHDDAKPCRLCFPSETQNLVLPAETAAPRAGEQSCVTLRHYCPADGTETQALLRCADEALIEYVGRLQSALHTLRTRVLDVRSGACFLSCAWALFVCACKHAMLVLRHPALARCVQAAWTACNDRTCSADFTTAFVCLR